MVSPPPTPDWTATTKPEAILLTKHAASNSQTKGPAAQFTPPPHHLPSLRPLAHKAWAAQFTDKKVVDFIVLPHAPYSEQWFPHTTMMEEFSGEAVAIAARNNAAEMIIKRWAVEWDKTEGETPPINKKLGKKTENSKITAAYSQH